MSALVTLVYILAGALQGRTVKLGGYQFVDGRFTVRDTLEQHALRSRFLAMNWQAFPEGDPRIEQINAAYKEAHGDVQREVSLNGAGPNGSADIPGNGESGESATDPGAADGGAAAATATGEAERAAAGGDGQPPSLTNDKLGAAVRGLDPTVDANWTKDGRPAMTAVEAAYGSAGITRAEVEAAAPGFNRDEALGLKGA